MSVLEETKSRLAVARKDREVLMEQRKKEHRNALILENWLVERQRMKVGNTSDFVSIR